MRVLLRFACGFAVSAALTLCLLPETAALMLAAGLLLLSLLLGIRRKMAWVPLLGLALGFVWTVGYQAAFVKPAMTLSGRTVEITGTATDYSMETACGVRVPAAISDGNETADAMVWLYTEEPLKPGDRFSVLANIRSAAAENGNYYPSEGIFLLAYGKTEPELTLRQRCRCGICRGRLPTQWKPLYKAVFRRMRWDMPWRWPPGTGRSCPTTSVRISKLPESITRWLCPVCT